MSEAVDYHFKVNSLVDTTVRYCEFSQYHALGAPHIHAVANFAIYQYVIIRLLGRIRTASVYIARSVRMYSIWESKCAVGENLTIVQTFPICRNVELVDGCWMRLRQ